MAKGKDGKTEVVDEYSEKIDMCLTDGVIKTGGGILLGSLSSLLFLGRRRWPIIAGAGVGIGLAYANYKGFMSLADDVVYGDNYHM